MKTISTEDLMSIWENKNFLTFVKSNYLYITFYFGDLIININDQNED